MRHGRNTNLSTDNLPPRFEVCHTWRRAGRKRLYGMGKKKKREEGVNDSETEHHKSLQLSDMTPSNLVKDFISRLITLKLTQHFSDET